MARGPRGPRKKPGGWRKGARLSQDPVCETVVPDPPSAPKSFPLGRSAAACPSFAPGAPHLGCGTPRSLWRAELHSPTEGLCDVDHQPLVRITRPPNHGCGASRTGELQEPMLRARSLGLVGKSFCSFTQLLVQVTERTQVAADIHQPNGEGEGEEGGRGGREKSEEKPLLTGALASIGLIVNVPGASDIQTAQTTRPRCSPPVCNEPKVAQLCFHQWLSKAVSSNLNQLASGSTSASWTLPSASTCLAIIKGQDPGKMVLPVNSEGTLEATACLWGSTQPLRRRLPICVPSALPAGALPLPPPKA